MPGALYEKVEKHLEKVGAVDLELAVLLPHFKRTAYWIEILKPNADEALKIAALAHDFDRLEDLAETRKKVKESTKGTQDKDNMRQHEEVAAERICNFLIANGADKKMADRVSEIVSRHEEGGTEEQNLLKDADSISFLENNIEHFIDMISWLGIEKVKVKFDYMYNRITTNRAKEIARPMYTEALRKIQEIN